MDRRIYKNIDLITVSKYFNLYVFISFMGWLWETLYVFLNTGELHDRGFLTLPLCPIYATVLVSAYLLLGTIKEERGIMRYVGSSNARALIYLCLCFILPTIAELLVGAFFLGVFDMRLWDYSALNYNTAGHIALEISALWSLGIFIFMNKVFPKIKSIVFKTNARVSRIMATILASAIFIDLAIAIMNAK